MNPVRRLLAASLNAAVLDAIFIQGQVCADARRQNGNELPFLFANRAR